MSILLIAVVVFGTLLATLGLLNELLVEECLITQVGMRKHRDAYRRSRERIRAYRTEVRNQRTLARAEEELNTPR